MARKNKGPVLTKEEKLLGIDTCREMEAMTAESLSALIVEANKSISDTKAELEENTKYQEHKQAKAAMDSGFNEVKRRQNGRIAYALKLREAQGK